MTEQEKENKRRYDRIMRKMAKTLNRMCFLVGGYEREPREHWLRENFMRVTRERARS